MMNWIERASALLRWKFWIIWGEKTTTVGLCKSQSILPPGVNGGLISGLNLPQQAIDIELQGEIQSVIEDHPKEW